MEQWSKPQLASLLVSAASACVGIARWGGGVTGVLGQAANVVGILGVVGLVATLTWFFWPKGWLPRSQRGIFATEKKQLRAEFDELIRDRDMRRRSAIHSIRVDFERLRGATEESKRRELLAQMRTAADMIQQHYSDPHERQFGQPLYEARKILVNMHSGDLPLEVDRLEDAVSLIETLRNS